MKTTRRSFIAVLSTFAAGAILHPFRAWAERSNEARLFFKLTALIPDRTAAASLGRAYLPMALDEGNPQRLADLVCGSSPEIKKRIVESTPGARREILLRLIAEDFEKSRTVTLNGWILSQTEARLFALVSLL